MTTMTKNLSLDFVDRTIKTTGIVLLIVFIFGIYYFGVYSSLAIFSGGVWALINLIFLTILIKAAIKPGEIDKMKVAGLALVKFPLLYVSGYFLLKVEVFKVEHLVIGFSIPLAVIILKVISRALFGLDNKTQKDEHLEGAL